MIRGGVIKLLTINQLYYMRKVFYCLTALAGLAMAASCTLNKLEQPVQGGAEGTIVSFTATVPQADTKAVVHEGESGPEVYWSPGDRVYVYRADWGWSSLTAQNTEPSPTTTFSGSVYGAAGEIDAKHQIWALYPRLENENVSFYPDSLIVPMHFIQNPVEGSFDPQSLLMLAQTTTREMAFYHVGGGFKFKVSGDWIRQVEFRSNDGTPLAGRVVLKMDGAGRPVVTKVEEGVNSITMTMPGSECFKPDTWYYMNMLPAVLEKGYTLFFRSETQTGTVVVNDAREIKRAVWASLKDDAAADTNADIQPETNIIRNEIWYTTTDEKIVTPSNDWNFGANIISNEYKDGKGVIVFDGPVAQIPDNAFNYKENLATVTLPNTVRTIGNYAFAFNYDHLTQVSLSDGVTTIGDYAFAWDYQLAEFWLPSTLQSVGNYVFASCTNLSQFSGPLASEDGHFLIIDGALITAVYTGYDEDFADIPEGVTRLADRAFAENQSIKRVRFPQSLQTIGEAVLYLCSKLEALEGKFVEDGRYLVQDGEIKAVAVNGLTEVTFPSSVTAIAMGAFYNAWQLQTLSIPAAVTRIGDIAFAGCGSLQEVEIEGAAVEFGAGVFRYDSSIRKFTGPLAQNERYLVSTDQTLIAFAPQGATEAIVPDGVTTIGASAFENQYNLTAVTIPATVTTIGDGAFRWCDNLMNVTLPEGLLSIGSEAFYSCKTFTTFEIPPTVIKVGYNILTQCQNLEHIWVLPTTPPACPEGYQPLGWDFGNPIIHVPASSLEAYQSVNGWRRQSNYQAIVQE